MNEIGTIVLALLIFVAYTVIYLAGKVDLLSVMAEKFSASLNGAIPADDRLKALGFTLKDFNVAGSDRYWNYENKREDQIVQIYYDDGWMVYSESISTHDNLWNEPCHEPVALRQDEMMVFLDKIKELDKLYGESEEDARRN